MAPVYQRGSVASDQNAILMQVTKRIAPTFGLAALFHEKPFRGINGSGKHNNWSVGNRVNPNLMEPGPDPANNKHFLVTVAGVIRGADLYQDLIRYSVSGAPNDHRLGAHEAPPAIISVYLGDWLNELVVSIIEGRPQGEGHKLTVDLGVGYLPELTRDPTDRNRTSPFSWTGNKFEVRCVGSSQRPAVSLIMLNSLLADSFAFFATEVKKYTAAGDNHEQAWRKLVKDTLTKHQRIIFNGNGYSEEWVTEAEKRKLFNYKTTPEVLNAIVNEKNIKLFQELQVWTEEEFKAVVSVDMERYVKILNYESQALVHLADKMIIPAAIDYQSRFVALGDRAPKKRLDQLTQTTNAAVDASDELKDSIKKIDPHHLEGDLKDLIVYARDKVYASQETLRASLDALENLMDANVWPLPSYNDILHLST